jgi:high-affinity Fe2+/Pb2+ permease
MIGLFTIFKGILKSQKQTEMDKQIGVWIDSKKAKIVTLVGDQRNLKTIDSEIETRERIPGESKQFGRFGDQYLDHEKSKEQKIKKQSGDFFKTIMQELSGCDSIVIFGPANMKHELEKEIKKNHLLSSKLAEVVATDSMTDNQTSAWVADFFKNSK